MNTSFVITHLQKVGAVHELVSNIEIRMSWDLLVEHIKESCFH